MKRLLLLYILILLSLISKAQTFTGRVTDKGGHYYSTRQRGQEYRGDDDGIWQGGYTTKGL